MVCGNEALTRFKLPVCVLLNAQEELQHSLVVVVELFGAQGINHKVLVDETNGKSNLEFRHLGRGDILDLRAQINN